MSDTPIAPQRETREIKTPHGHSVLIKTYLTGREANEFRRVVFEKTKFKMVDDPLTDPAENKKKVESEMDMDGSIIIDQQLAAMAVCVLSLDNKTENLVELLQDLPSDDFDEVDKACAELTKGIFQKVKP